MNDAARNGVGEHPALLPWYVDGNLDPVSMREVEQHLAHCAACQREVEALASMRDSIRGVHAGPDRPLTADELRMRSALLRSSHGRRRAAWTFAAAMLLVCAAVFLFWLTRPSPSSPVAITFLPAQRGVEQVPVLEGRGPWSITVVLPFDAPAGTYGASIEAEDGTTLGGVGSALSSESDARLSVRVASLPGPGPYRLVIRSESEATTYSYPFRLQAGESSKP